MSEVEKVALWAGLIASIVSIVLSIVAIAFAILVNQRSERVSDQTLKSLQKIESTVERLSSDTTGLIKGAWDKMLGGLGTPQEPAKERLALKEIASGMADEVRVELGLADQTNKAPASPELIQRFESALQNLEESIQGQLASGRRSLRPGTTFAIYRTLKQLTPEARELASAIRGFHLTRQQYKALADGPLAAALRELRQSGLLVPLRDPDQTLVYWFPSDRSELVKLALVTLDPSSADVGKHVESELQRVGYHTRAD